MNAQKTEIKLNGERIEEVYEFKHFDSILCKYGSIEYETRERAVNGKKVVGFLEPITKGRTLSMEAKKECVME